MEVNSGRRGDVVDGLSAEFAVGEEAPSAELWLSDTKTSVFSSLSTMVLSCVDIAAAVPASLAGVPSSILIFFASCVSAARIRH